jgi:hypothetical protein
VLDGAMGTEIQMLGLSDDAFRGDRFCDHGCDLAGNNELLTLTQPDAMRDIHLRYLLAGADIVETNTFSANRVSQGDYDTVDQVVELNEVAARLAREAAEEAHGRDGRRRFVAGAVGPTNMTLSLSPKVEDPGYRAITFSALADAYQEQIEALLRGGVDLILIETIFDTLNAKAAIVASRRAMNAPRRAAAADDLRHDHRPFGPHPVGADPRRVLAVDPPRPAADRRPQLCPRRRGDATPRARARHGRRHAGVRVSQRRPAERTRRLRRDPDTDRGLRRRVRRRRAW